MPTNEGLTTSRRPQVKIEGLTITQIGSILLTYITWVHCLVFLFGYITCAVLFYDQSGVYLGPFTNFIRWSHAYYILMIEQSSYTRLMDVATGSNTHCALTSAATVMAMKALSNHRAPLAYQVTRRLNATHQDIHTIADVEARSQPFSVHELAVVN